MWEWGAMRDERAEEVAEGGGRALCATGVDADGVVVAFIFDAFKAKMLYSKALVIMSAPPVLLV